MALEGHRGLELVRRVVGREALEDGLVEAARRLRAVRLEAVLYADDAVRRVLDEAAQEGLGRELRDLVEELRAIVESMVR